MTREEAIKGLEQFKADFKPFCGNDADWERFDAGLALLKEQPEIVRCKDCRWYDEKISFCDNCHLPREQTFFCADGKRR